MKKRNEENYVKHTYQFYKDRRNDPKWRPAYLKARQQRIIWIVVGTIFILLIGSISFLAYSYSNASKGTPTESFNKSSEQSSSPEASSSSSSKKELQNMDNLDLNTKIAILAQAYFALNPSTTILQAPSLAMSNNWDNGSIEWYDEQGAKHKLNVNVNGDVITYDYIDATTGSATTQTASVDESITRYLLPSNANKVTEQIAKKVVNSLESSKEKSNVSKEGGKFMNGHFVVSYQEMSDFFYNTENTAFEMTPQQLADFWNIHHDKSKQINSPVDLRVNMDYAIWSKDYISKPLTLTAKQLVHIYGTSLNSKAIQSDMSEANIQSAVDSWNKNHPSYNAVAFVEGSNGEYTSFPDITDYNDPRFYTHTKIGETVSKEQAMSMVNSGWVAHAMGVPEASAGPEH